MYVLNMLSTKQCKEDVNFITVEYINHKAFQNTLHFTCSFKMLLYPIFSWKQLLSKDYKFIQYRPERFHFLHVLIYLTICVCM